jgi:hypothetical protein
VAHDAARPHRHRRRRSGRPRGGLRDRQRLRRDQQGAGPRDRGPDADGDDRQRHGAGGDDRRHHAGDHARAGRARDPDPKPKGGVKRLTFTKGDRIRFRVRSDTADEIHVHGYDVHKDVTQGGTVTFSIPATIEGRFVVELEGQGEQIAELEVNPS